MLVCDPTAGRYNADATASTGSEALETITEEPLSESAKLTMATVLCFNFTSPFKPMDFQKIPANVDK